MAIPYFLDNPESNQGIIRQIIFPKFRGINKFLYQKFGDKMVYKEIAQSQNDEIVQFNFKKTLKSEEVINATAIPDLTPVTEIFHDLIVECLATIGLSEYIIAENPAFKESLKINWNPYIFSANPPDEFCVEKLMQAIFDNYVLFATISAPSLNFFIPNFMKDNPLKLSNPPTITDTAESEYNKYSYFLSLDSAKGALFTLEQYSLFDEDRLALAFSYVFYYALKDILSSCYLQITLPLPVAPPVNQLGLNILEEITLDLKNIPINITIPTKLVELVDSLNVAIAEQSILASPNASIVAPPPGGFNITRQLKSSAEELKGKLRNIHNYDNNHENIPVIQMEGENNGV